MARVASRPQGSVFSAKMSAVTAAIAAMFIMPSGNRMTNSSQQQPRHQTPCSRPIRSAPAVPSRQEVMMKPTGVRHFDRQRSFSGVSW